MLISSVKQMQEADKRAIQTLGIPGSVLMYNAAKSVTDHINVKYPNANNFGILCGKGNGGDGFAIAHILTIAGKSAKVVALGKEEDYKGDAAIYLQLAKREGINIKFPCDIQQCIEETKSLNNCDLIVDALLGTGTKGEVREPFKSVINNIAKDMKVVAVDLPSGMNGDTGEICGCCVKASSTITFAAAKKGIVNREEYTGELHVADIGMPPICLNDEEWEKFINKKL
jgi:NAD(P)H-hydrate epimerase